MTTKIKFLQMLTRYFLQSTEYKTKINSLSVICGNMCFGGSSIKSIWHILSFHIIDEMTSISPSH